MANAKTKVKPKYPMYKTVGYMLGKAWHGHKSVLMLCIMAASLAVAENLIGLFIAPTILEKVEQTAPLQNLLWTILVFAAALMGCRALAAYLNTNTIFGRISTRLSVLNDIHQKCTKTSYPNVSSPDFLELQRKAQSTTNSNHSAAERIWSVLAELLKNLLGFGIYLALLSNLNPILMVVVLVTTIIGHFISKRINEWGYRHREEEKDYMNHFYYVDGKCTDIALAKDIRIFGMVDWLSEIYHNSILKWRQFYMKAEKIYAGTIRLDEQHQGKRHDDAGAQPLSFRQRPVFLHLSDKFCLKRDVVHPSAKTPNGVSTQPRLPPRQRGW